MEQKINPSDEARLVSAIEKAASRTTVNENLDRSATLAEELKNANIPAKFAKVATGAYNKRLTVMTFKQRSDEERVKPFELADGDKVASLMEPGIDLMSNAPVEAPAFSFVVNKAASANMSKAASTQENTKETANNKLPFEYRVDRDVFMTKLESLVDLHTSILEEMLQKQSSLECALRKDCEKLADNLSKNAFVWDTLKNLHGEKLKSLLGDYMPEGTSFEKTAHGAIRPKEGIYDCVDTLLAKKAEFDERKQFVQEYAEGLTEFAKSASDFADHLRKRDRGELEKSAGYIDTVGGITSLIHSGIGAAGGAGRAGLDITHTLVDTTDRNISNARELWQKGLDVSKHPSSVVDAEFMLYDRYRDRMMGWADMAADPQFSMYPAEQVFKATQKAMNVDTSLERPDRRELLRTTVGQLLAQNNRLSGADIAALGTTIKGLEGSKGNIQSHGRAAVKALDKVTGTDPANVALGVADLIDRARSRGKDTANVIKDVIEAVMEDRKEVLKGQKEDAKRDEDLAAAADKEMQRRVERDQDLRNKEKERKSKVRAATAERKAQIAAADKDRASRERIASTKALNDAAHLQAWREYLAALAAARAEGKRTERPVPPPRNN